MPHCESSIRRPVISVRSALEIAFVQRRVHGIEPRGRHAGRRSRRRSPPLPRRSPGSGRAGAGRPRPPRGPRRAAPVANQRRRTGRDRVALARVRREAHEMDAAATRRSPRARLRRPRARRRRRGPPPPRAAGRGARPLLRPQRCGTAQRLRLAPDAAAERWPERARRRAPAQAERARERERTLQPSALGTSPVTSISTPASGTATVAAMARTEKYRPL